MTLPAPPGGAKRQPAPITNPPSREAKRTRRRRRRTEWINIPTHTHTHKKMIQEKERKKERKKERRGEKEEEKKKKTIDGVFFSHVTANDFPFIQSIATRINNHKRNRLEI